jgi:hypothetical protein
MQRSGNYKIVNGKKVTTKTVALDIIAQEQTAVLHACAEQSEHIAIEDGSRIIRVVIWLYTGLYESMGSCNLICEA